MTAAVLFVLMASRTLSVGPGKQYSNISAAVAAAQPGDRVDIYQSRDDYRGEHVLVKTPDLTIAGVGAKPVTVDGAGFDFSGVGSVPRAIFQFNPSSSGCRLVNLELEGAHNKEGNGAGVRINQARNVTVEGCRIHGCDMGIMSNGKNGDPHAAENQLFDHCEVWSNGSQVSKGYSHNLYLGGTSAVVRFCKVHDSVVGHNIKSRCHLTTVAYSWIYHASDREFDLVDAWDTERPGSDAILIGDVIEKNPNCTGNRGVIHYGIEHGKHNGALILKNDTIITYFKTPIIDVNSASGACGASRCAFFCLGNHEGSVFTAAGSDHGQAIKVTSCGLARAGHEQGKLEQGNLTSLFIIPLRPGDLRGNRTVRQPASFKVSSSNVLAASADCEFRYVGDGNWEPVQGTSWLGAG